ncbi:MAG: FAD-binding protein [Terriglobia bacterium]
MTWTAELAKIVAGQVLLDEATRDAVATDFGRLIVRKPSAVVRPASAQDVANVVRFSAKNSLGVSTRGGGHSQTGQSLSEHIVLDMTSLSDVRRIDEQGGYVVCQAGLTWRGLVEQLAARQLSPPVLTNNLDVTIGGTLSSGGLGVASWRHGTQADNCLELEVVTGTGEIVRCSPEQDRDLFDAVRAGMGQFGVITEAMLKLRRHHPKFRSYYLLYDNLNFLLEDLQTLMVEERFDYLESWCAPCPQGFRKVGEGRTPFAQWFFPLHGTIETDGTSHPETTKKLAGLRLYKHVHSEDGEIGEFFARLDGLFALWKRGGAWDFTHPWMECVLPWQSTMMYISRVLENFPPQALVGGHILLWPARGNVSAAPLFMRPKSDFVMGFGILPAFPKHLVEEPLFHLNMASQGAMMLGGKRYLSGWIKFDHNQWKAHYGEMWSKVVELKKKFDPQGVLNPGFVLYD